MSMTQTLNIPFSSAEGTVKTHSIQQPSLSGANPEVKMSASDVRVFYGQAEALHGVSLDVFKNEVVAFIGPSGCGKSTFLRAFNRMNDTVAGARVKIGRAHV